MALENPNSDVYSNKEDNMLDYKERLSKKDRVRMWMSEIEDDAMMELLVAISEAESLLINRLFHERHSGFRCIHGDRGDLGD